MGQIRCARHDSYSALTASGRKNYFLAVIDFLSLLLALTNSVFAVTVQPVGLPAMTVPATNGTVLVLEASDNLTNWARVRPSFECTLSTNGFSQEIRPLTWHYTTNVIPTTNIWRQNNQNVWDYGLLYTNDQPVTEMMLTVDQWQTNLHPRIEWKPIQQEPSTNTVPKLFLRLRSNG